jgi:hypothetical protein
MTTRSEPAELPIPVECAMVAHPDPAQKTATATATNVMELLISPLLFFTEMTGHSL